MKKFLMALAATTLAVSPALTAQAQAAPKNHKTTVTKQVTYKNNGKRVVTTKKTIRNATPARYSAKTVRHTPTRVSYTQKRWAKGQRFNSRQAVNYRVINNPRAYRLSNAPRGYQWVRSGNDAVLIAVTSGIIGAVIGNAISR